MTDDNKRRRPTPTGLGTTGRALWREVIDTYDLDPAEVVLLRELCATVDEIARMTADLAEMGVIVAGSRGQPVANPLLAHIATHRKLADQLVVALALPSGSETVGRRRSAQAKQAVDSRWRAANRRGRLPTVTTNRQEEGA